MIIAVENTKNYNRSLDFNCDINKRTSEFVVSVRTNNNYFKRSYKDFETACKAYEHVPIDLLNGKKEV